MRIHFPAARFPAVHFPANRLNQLARASSWLVIVLTLAGVVSFLLRGITYEVSISLVTLVLFICIQFFVNRFRWIHNPPGMQLFNSLIVFVSVTFGRFFFLYRDTVWFDKVTHVLYGMAFCIIGYALFYRMNASQREKLTVSPVTILFFAACFGMTCSFMWEIYEFTYDRLFGTNMQHWLPGPATGVTDTMLDMVADFVGANLVGLLWLRESSRDPQAFFQKRMAPFLDFSSVEERIARHAAGHSKP
jgi:uncharacterized membrane protein YjdF